MTHNLNKTQREVLAEIARVWDRFPHLRFGQLFDNVSTDYDKYYMTDTTLLELLKQYPEGG